MLITSRPVQRRRLIQGGLAVVVAPWLPTAKACEFFASTLRITHPWTRATPEDATSAIVCMKFDQVLQDDRLIGADTTLAASAEMGGQTSDHSTRPMVDFAVYKGQDSQLSESGTFLRLLGLNQPLEVGRAYPMTLHFEKGGSIAVDLSVDYASFL